MIHDDFKCLKNNVTYATGKCKKVYFKRLCEKVESYMPLIWKGVWWHITLKCKTKRQRNILTLKGKDVTNSKNIANPFKNYFTNTSPSLSESIPFCKK